MTSWTANLIAIALVGGLAAVWALALLWRLGSWHVSPAAKLTFDEGLRIGSEAPEAAAYALDGTDRHLSFGGRQTFVVFGAEGCRPCAELLGVAPKHPATSTMRLVYLGGGEDFNPPPDVVDRWEIYRFHDEEGTRQLWRAPVSPYFHVIDRNGRIAEKGIANHALHLDRLLALRPIGASGPHD